ncbi:hypothetical protein Ae505Ps2_6250c [Pseudonocardia sp. Ae505_Ps2]|nr:hypothetical protein Ae505Ps2_6250c [Pseudonocardia sp. Ae505_Ps2]
MVDRGSVGRAVVAAGVAAQAQDQDPQDLCII